MWRRWFDAFMWSFSVFEMGSCYAPQAGLELATLQLQPSE